MPRVRPDSLRALAAAIIARGGSEPEEARWVSEHLVRANLCGHDSHGVGMIPAYVRFLAQGLLVPNTPARLLREDGGILQFDGGRGYGQRVAREATGAALARGCDTGLALMTLRNAHHIGRVGSYGEQCIAAGLVGLGFVNVIDHGPLVAPFRGSDARYGTNPICVAIPGSGGSEPVLLDMATSRIPLGKTRVAMNEGRQVPPGHLLDGVGRPTTDPRVMFQGEPRGALLPLGEHKGSGLQLICELLAGVLSGGGTIQPGTPRQGAIINNLCLIVIDPARLGERAWMDAELDAMLAYAKGSPPADPAEGVQLAGEPERACAVVRGREGIPVDPTTWEELLAAGEAVGLERGEAHRLARVE